MPGTGLEPVTRGFSVESKSPLLRRSSRLHHPSMNFTVSQIPTSITTVEQLHAWSGMLLHRANSSLKVVESENYSDFAAQASVFQAQDGTQRFVSRMNLELNAGYAESGQKLWTQIQPFSEVAIPAAFTS